MPLPLSTAEREKLILSHQPLVESLVSELLKSVILQGMEREDLVQDGRIGLIKAADRFDPDMGVQFSTYATHMIRSELLHALRDRGRLVRVPAWKQEARETDREELFNIDELLGADEDNGGPGMDANYARHVQQALSCDSDEHQTDARLFIESALPQLKADRAEALRLHYFEELPKTEVAARMGIHPNWAAHLIKEGLQDLRRIAEETK